MNQAVNHSNQRVHSSVSVLLLLGKCLDRKESFFDPPLGNGLRFGKYDLRSQQAIVLIAELEMIVNQELHQPLHAIQPRQAVTVLLIAHIFSILSPPKSLAIPAPQNAGQFPTPLHLTWSFALADAAARPPRC